LNEPKEIRHVDEAKLEPSIGAALNRDLSSRSEDAAQREIDRFIEHRSMKLRAENQERREEEAWIESARQAEEKHRQQIRREWCQHHMTQAERLRRTLEELISDHDRRAEELMGGGDAA
jgi:hypothetical protein